ncbi:MAG: alpha-galactosidase [Planctomycetes bacterium]|nr:alpha-galactosidase [Planctomycetota bacterium]
MPRIAFIGAGSYGFTHRLLVDILSYDSLRDSEFTFMDVDKKRLARVRVLVGEYLKTIGLDDRKPVFTTHRKRALEGADFVINLVKVGFLKASIMDMDVPKKFGLKQTIGDTCGIAGVFRGLRTMPFCIQLCKEIEQRSAPNAMVLNYTNPQSMLVMATAATSRVPFIGLCHSVQGTTRVIARYLNVPYEELTYEAAGINHMNWITKLQRNGKNLYPRLRRLVKERGIYGHRPKDDDQIRPFLGPARLDMLNRVGYVVTESSTHFPEYVPYYLRNDELIEKYRIPIDQYRKNIANKEKNHGQLYRNAKKGKLPEMKRSVEYGSQIINSVVTNSPCAIYANVPNAGLVTNLPDFSAVEVACLVDRSGVRPCHYGALPTQLAALCMMNIHVHQLAVEAILKKSRRSVYWALMMDPLTHSVLTIDQIEEVVDTLVARQPEYLGKHLGKAD